MNIGGVRFGASLADVERKWGAPSSRAGDKLRYEQGPTVSVMTVGASFGLMFDFGPLAHPWVQARGKGPLSILGKPCEEAAKSLDFATSVGSYTTCKHYERSAMVDITLLCPSGTVSTVAVVWLQYDPIPAESPLPPDECTGSDSPRTAAAPSCKTKCDDGESLDSETGCCKPNPPAKLITYSDPPVKVSEVRYGGATFRMGDTGREVKVGAFFIDDIEVTVSAYAACVAAGRCTAPADKKGCNWEHPERGNHPINCVTLNQAETYCKWKDKRVPTEEEWEWAASNGERGTSYPWGNDPPRGQMCWNGAGNDKGKGNRRTTCVVGSYPKGNNAKGVKDLGGNVWEWTTSKYSADENHVVVRGFSVLDDIAGAISVFRLRNLPTEAYSNFGFRCVRTP